MLADIHRRRSAPVYRRHFSQLHFMYYLSNCHRPITSSTAIHRNRARPLRRRCRNIVQRRLIVGAAAVERSLLHTVHELDDTQQPRSGRLGEEDFLKKRTRRTFFRNIKNRKRIIPSTKTVHTGAHSLHHGRVDWIKLTVALGRRLVRRSRRIRSRRYLGIRAWQRHEVMAAARGYGSGMRV